MTGAKASVADGDTHVAGSTFDDAHGRLNAGAVEVGQLGLGDLLKLRSLDGANASLGGLSGTFGDSSSLGDQHGRWGRLGDEGEAAVFKDRDLHRDHETGFVLGAGVVLLAERHDVDPVLTEGRTHGRCRVGFAGLKGQLDHSYDFLGHRRTELNICGSPGPRGRCGGVGNHP